MPTNFRSDARSYFVAVGATAAAVALHLLLGGRLGDSVPIFALVGAIVGAAWYGGLRGGLLATVLCSLAGIYFFIHPASRILTSLPHAAAITVFFTVGALVSFLSESLHKAQRRYETERANLQEREERFALALKHSHTGAWDYDLGLGRAVWSETLHDIAGLPPSVPLTAESILALIHPDDRESVLQATRPMIESAREITVEFRICSPHRGERWIFVAGKGAATGGGAVRRLTGIARDITDQRRAEDALRVVQQQLQLIADTMEAPVTRCSRDLKYLWVNKPYADWISRPIAEIVGRPIVEIIGQEAFAHLRPHFEQVLSGQRVQYEALVNWQSRGRRWINATYSPTFDRTGATDGWVAVVIDVHERKELEEALKEADRRKDAFLATLAHELRNPLAPIRSSLAILNAKTPPDPELTWSRDVIDRQVQQMVRLLDDLLDVSRISRNKLQLRTERVEFSDVVASAIETSRPLIDASRHELQLVLPQQSVHLDADPIRLAQVLSNLLNNAAKYTPPGGRIVLEAAAQDSDVVVTVTDNGIGIAAESFPHLFEMFSQAAPALSRSQGGLGIGLSLAKGLVELHGGSLEARSEGVGKGSQFVVRLPVAQCVTPPPKRPSRHSGEVAGQSKRRVLVVDDNHDAADSLARMLRIMGHDVQVAYDGEQGVQAAGNWLPELVFLDIGMPKLNGYEAAQRIRVESWGAQMVLVALTGWGREEDRRASNGAGFNFHLVKPADAAAIARLTAGLPANGAARESDSRLAALASHSQRP
jgi:PAS domain S-box-containing protein